MSEFRYFDSRERALVIGLGRSGVASCRVLRERGASVIATDENASALPAGTIADLQAIGVSFVPPEHLDKVFGELSVCVLSPGVPLNGTLVRRVQGAGIPVFSEIEVAYRICRAPIVAITGTKGKTTTTALVGALFRAAGKTTHVGGNIGNALIAETSVAQPADWVIAEVSSFQLETIRSFKPRISAILNISPDHLDRYYSMEEYAEAKFRIFANQDSHDVFVGNFDDPYLQRLHSGDDAKRLHARSEYFSPSGNHHAAVYLHGDSIVHAPPTGDPRTLELLRIAEIPLIGTHNVANVMAAFAIGLAAGLDLEAMRDAVRRFAPLPHRLAPVAEIDGVRYVDDSKATNPSSVVAALTSFAQPVVLIAGGRSKRTDFNAMRAAIAAHARAVVLIGEAADEIARVVGAIPVHRAASMEEAVQTARGIAQQGDVVLLSPGCTSFDMFISAEARGDAFVAAVSARVPSHGL